MRVSSASFSAIRTSMVFRRYGDLAVAHRNDPLGRLGRARLGVLGFRLRG